MGDVVGIEVVLSFVVVVVWLGDNKEVLLAEGHGFLYVFALMMGGEREKGSCMW